MKKIILAVLTASTMLVAGGAIAPVSEAPQEPARERLYVGIGIDAGETYARGSHTNFTGYSEGEYTNVGLTAIAGYDALKFENSNVFVEARVGTSLWMEDSEEITTTAGSLLLKPVYNFTNQFGVYGLVGGTYVDWTDNVDGWLDHSGWGLSVGLGAQLQVASQVYVFADYLLNATDNYSYFFEDNVNFDLTTIGLLYKF